MQAKYFKIAIFILSFGLSGYLCSQTLPKPLATLLQHADVQPGSVTTIESITEAQHDFFWQDTKVNKEGYLEIVSPLAYLSLIDDAAALAIVPSEDELPFGTRLNLYSLKGFSYSGVFKESNYRTTFIFRSNNENSLMLTIWDYQSNGSKIVLVGEFLNQMVNDLKGTLAFTSATATKQGIWKLSWFSEKLGYELYVKDKIDESGHLTYSPKEIVRIGVQLTQI